jgi:hypothetical protein
LARQKVWIARDDPEAGIGVAYARCVHCGQPVIVDAEDRAECEHGVCHDECRCQTGAARSAPER